jgi:hypothetical protein
MYGTCVQQGRTLRFMGLCRSLAMRALYLVDCSLHLLRATSRISVLTASIFSAIIGSSSALTSTRDSEHAYTHAVHRSVSSPLSVPSRAD